MFANIKIVPIFDSSNGTGSIGKTCKKMETQTEINPVDVMPGDVMVFTNKVGVQITEEVIKVNFPYVVSKYGYGSILDKVKLREFKVLRSI